MSVFYMSFADDERGGFQGALVMEAPTLLRAIKASHLLGINPGGEVLSIEHDTPEAIAHVLEIFPRDKWFRLLSADEVPDAVGLDGEPRKKGFWDLLGERMEKS